MVPSDDTVATESPLLPSDHTPQDAVEPDSAVAEDAEDAQDTEDEPAGTAAGPGEEEA
jgi:hypothetical protein